MYVTPCFFFFVVQIEFVSCIFENKNEQDFFDEINHERKLLGLPTFQIHLILQLAAQKRCANREQLLQVYEQTLFKTYKDDEWPKHEQLNQIFPNVSETIILRGFPIHEQIFRNIYRVNYVFIGLAVHAYQNFSAKCILVGSSTSSMNNHHRLLRLLYILIGCGILLVSLIVSSLLNDRRRAKLQQDILEHTLTNDPKKSMTVFIDKDGKSALPRRAEINRVTMAHLGSLVDERRSAVHSFFQSPK